MVAPNVTTPPDTLFTVRLPQLTGANRTNMRAFKRVNSVPAAPRFSDSATSGAKRSSTASAALDEVGPTVDPFPTAGQFASWAGMCPGNNESAGKRRTGRTRKGNRWLRQAVVRAGWAASHSKTTYLGARYRRVARRRGAKRALLAVGHTLLVIVYQVLRQRIAYRELGADCYDRLQSERLTRHLVRRLEQLGHKVTLEDRTATEPQAQRV